MRYVQHNHSSVFIFSDADLCYSRNIAFEMEEIDNLQENIIIDLRGITGLSRKGVRFLFGMIEKFRKMNKEPLFLGALWTLRFMEVTGFKELVDLKLTLSGKMDNINKVMDCEKNLLWDALSGE